LTDSFLHGVQTLDIAGTRPIQTPPTAVVEIVGTAPVFLGTAGVNTPTLVLGDTDAAAFGPNLPGYTIPSALKAILDFGAAQIIVINIFDPDVHQSQVYGEAITLGPDKTATLANGAGGILNATVRGTWNESPVYGAGTDYTLDPATGKITGLTIGAATTLLVDYTYGDPSQVTEDDLIGATSIAGVRTGLQASVDVVHLFNMKPRILLMPGYSGEAPLRNELLGMADKLKAHAYLDVPIGATVSQVITGRGSNGVIDLATGSRRAVLCYPFVQVAGILEPYSQNLAGLAASVDLNEGFWVSPSNHTLTRVEALERPITWSLGDPSCEANQLNAVGIVTAVRGYGTGFLAWGNRSAAWPTDTDPRNFICVQVVQDVFDEAVERAMLPYVDRPLNRATLDAVRETVNTYITGLVQKGALVGGSCTWSPADNPTSELALGHAVFTNSIMPPVPMEEITFKSQVDTTWLATLYSTAA
jgi:hypothetical protein